jgi:transporter family protein
MLNPRARQFLPLKIARLPAVASPSRCPPLMNWIAATLASAVFLGCYDLCTKHAVRDNAVLPVLFLANLCSAIIWLSLLELQRLQPGLLPPALLVPHLTLFQHAQLALKSLIVAASWLCTYFAVKHLPVSIASPLRATGPVWTLAGALLFLAERPTVLQMLGIITTIGSFILLSAAGRGEGIHFHRDKWIWWLVAGTILGAVSGLYDKYLLGRLGFAPSTVQAWFAIYLALLFLPLAVGWKWRWWSRNEFHWRWSIPFLSITLLIADFLYFGALRDPTALIALVASLRRGSTLVAFAGGLMFFGERSSRQKLLAVLGIFAGMVLTLWK